MKNLATQMIEKIEANWPDVETIHHKGKFTNEPRISYVVNQNPPFLLDVYDRDPKNMALSLLLFPATHKLFSFVRNQGRGHFPADVRTINFFEFKEDAVGDIYPIHYHEIDEKQVKGNKSLDEIIEIMKNAIKGGAMDSGG